MTPMMPGSPAATWSAMAALAEERNRFVAEVAAAAVVVHAAAGSRTEGWCRVVMGKTVWTLDAAENGHLTLLGARPFKVEALPAFFVDETRNESVAASSQLDISWDREE